MRSNGELAGEHRGTGHGLLSRLAARYRVPIVALRLALVASNLAVFALAAQSVWQSRKQYEQRAATLSQNIAAGVDLTFTALVDRIDLSLRAIVDDMERQLDGRGIDRTLVEDLLPRHHERMPLLEAIHITNDKGVLVFGQGVGAGTRESVADRDFFVGLRNAGVGEMFVTRPTMRQIDAHQVMTFAHRFDAGDGSFAGVVFASLPVSQINRLLAQFNPGVHGSTFLLDPELAPITRNLGKTEVLGGWDMASASVEARNQIESKAHAATFFGPLDSSATPHAITIRRSRNAPLRFGVGVSSRDYLTPWHQEVMTTMAMAAGYLVLSLGFGFYLARMIRTNETLAFRDQLTGLPNRTLLLDRLHQAGEARRRDGGWGGVLLIDLDDFKKINDTLGHAKGDDLLRLVAGRLSDCVRARDTVARLGGDEFVVVFEDLGGDEGEAVVRARYVGEKILRAINQPYPLGDVVRHCTPSIGAALFHGLDTAPEEWLKQADLAMYQGKADGRNTLRFFDPGMQKTAEQRSEVEARLRRALEAREFLLHFQPQVDALDRVRGAEALVRWQDPQRGMVSPGEFIPVAEATGLIVPLGFWVLEAACMQLAAWADHPRLGKVVLAVNVSARQFHDRDFLDGVIATLQATGADPRRLKLELTESLLVDNVDEVIQKMHALRALGVAFALDDFGTGYSSLAYLSQLPVDQLKIDRSFVSRIEDDENAVAICAATIALGHSLNMELVAEGVETAAQRYVLSKAHGCELIQGYLVSRPLPLEQFEAFVAASPT